MVGKNRFAVGDDVLCSSLFDLNPPETIKRYADFFLVCADYFFQGPLGSVVGMSGSALCDRDLQHSGQFWTISSSCFESNCHHTACLARSWHFIIPW